MTPSPNIVALPSPQADFDRFWALYPRKTSKLDAMKAWQKAITMETPENIIAALEHQRKHRESWQRDSGQYIPYPASWLRAGAFWDVLETPLIASPVQGFSVPQSTAIAYAKSLGDTQGYVIHWIETRQRNNFFGITQANWKEMFKNDLERWRAKNGK